LGDVLLRSGVLGKEDRRDEDYGAAPAVYRLGKKL